MPRVPNKDAELKKVKPAQANKRCPSSKKQINKKTLSSIIFNAALTFVIF
jgi:hypothetical protein